MTATTYQTMRVETGDRRAVITVDRPEARNALSRQVLTELRDALAALRDDDRVGAVALTGAGERAVVAGADIPLAGLLDEARAVAARILAKGPLAVQLAKLVVRTGMDADQRTGLALERLARSLLYTTADKREGAEAFLGKRAPQFEGR